MTAKTNIIAAIAVLAAPALACAQASINADPGADDQPRWHGNAMSGACAATSKSSRATRSAQRGRRPPATDPSARRVTAPDGRDLGTDPDMAIRFQLRRDSGPGM